MHNNIIYYCAHMVNTSTKVLSSVVWVDKPLLIVLLITNSYMPSSVNKQEACLAVSSCMIQWSPQADFKTSRLAD